MDNIVFGRIPVKNSLLGKRKKKCLYLNADHPVENLLELARKEHVDVKLVSTSTLDKLSSFQNHQGAVLSLDAFAYTPLEELVAKVKEKEDSTIVLLDGIEDPVNLGSILRSSSAFDCDGVILGKNRQVGVNPTVSKIATGAEELLPIVQVTNLSVTIERLKKEGYWIVCSAGEGKDVYDEINYSGKIVLVIGSEGFGVSRLVREHSDFIASIPLPGPVKALNANIACSIFLSEIVSYRRKHKK